MEEGHDYALSCGSTKIDKAKERTTNRLQNYNVVALCKSYGFPVLSLDFLDFLDDLYAFPTRDSIAGHCWGSSLQDSHACESRPGDAFEIVSSFQRHHQPAFS